MSLKFHATDRPMQQLRPHRPPVGEESIAHAIDLAAGLSMLGLTQPELYVGSLSSVRSYGSCRLLILNEHALEGHVLSVWLSEAALSADRSSKWIELTSMKPFVPVRVGVFGHFAGPQGLERLSADVWNAEDIWLSVKTPAA